MEEEHSHHHHHHQLHQIAESTPTISVKPSPPSQITKPTSEKLESPTNLTQRKISIRIQKDSEESDSGSSHLKIPNVITVSSSSETLTGI